MNTGDVNRLDYYETLGNHYSSIGEYQKALSVFNESLQHTKENERRILPN